MMGTVTKVFTASAPGFYCTWRTTLMILLLYFCAFTMVWFTCVQRSVSIFDFTLLTFHQTRTVWIMLCYLNNMLISLLSKVLDWYEILQTYQKIFNNEHTLKNNSEENFKVLNPRNFLYSLISNLHFLLCRTQPIEKSYLIWAKYVSIKRWVDAFVV